MCMQFMLAITTDDAYPTGKMLEDMQDMAWKAAKLKYPNTFAASTIMELTARTHRMMLHAAYEICGRAHTQLPRRWLFMAISLFQCPWLVIAMPSLLTWSGNS